VKNWFLVLGGLAALGLLALAGVAVRRSFWQSTFLDKPPPHGTAFVIEIVPGESSAGLLQLKEAMRGRASRLGLRLFWEPLSESRVRVSVPFQERLDLPAIQNAMFRRGILEFRLVHEQSAELLRDNLVPPGYEVLEHAVLPPEPRLPAGARPVKDPNANPQRRSEKYLVKKKPEAGLTGGVIQQALVVRGNRGDPEISFTLHPEATAAFGQVTRDNVGRQLAVVLDGKLLSAPVIRSPIESGAAVVNGDFTVREAFDIAGALESPLPVPVRVVEAKEF
jgi:preprotein translocase subunit SecD